VLPLQDERRSAARKKLLAKFNTNGTHHITLRRGSIILLLAIVFGALAPRTRLHVQHLNHMNPYPPSQYENSLNNSDESIWSKWVFLSCITLKLLILPLDHILSGLVMGLM
jgi:hypothetical protein